MDKEKNIKNKKDDSNADKVDGLKENLEFNKNYQVPKEEIDEDEIGNGYQLSFIGKNYAKLLAGQKTETVIVPDKKHNESKENKESGNVFIAGDNLDCLKHLENAYTGKVDVINIDKTLSDNAAVQTLSRLNRAAFPTDGGQLKYRITRRASKYER